MEYMQGPGGFYVEEDTAVTLGKFNGLHRGHQKLVKRILELERRDLRSVIFTLNSMERGQLLTDEERRKMAESMGVSYLIDCPLTPEITGMEPEEFVADVLARRLHARYLVVGTDFRFGHNRKGDYRLLGELQHKYGFCVEVVSKEQYQGRDVSSTYIREELAAGHMEMVNELLGYPFLVSGEVLHGRVPGRRLGLPTVNLTTTTRKLLPPDGLYATRVLVGRERFCGITNIKTGCGKEKSFRGVETYLFDFERELYGENIEVQFCAFMRPEMEFDSPEAQRMQMYRDIAYGKEYFRE